MDEPLVADNKPCKVVLEKDKRYFFCTCGKSSNQPFCDGAHKGTDFRPQKFVAEEDGEVYLCACKRTNKAPFCDGSHQKLSSEE